MSNSERILSLLLRMKRCKCLEAPPLMERLGVGVRNDLSLGSMHVQQHILPHITAADLTCCLPNCHDSLHKNLLPRIAKRASA